MLTPFSISLLFKQHISKISSYPVNTGLFAEIMSFGATEVIIRPEGLIERCDQVEKGLSAALV